MTAHLPKLISGAVLVTVAAGALGYVIDGPALAVYGAFSSALASAVGLLWVEVHRLRRAQASRTNRISERINALEHQSSRSVESARSQTAAFEKKVAAVLDDTLMALSTELEQVVETVSERQAAELARLRDFAADRESDQSERLAKAVEESTAKVNRDSTATVRDQNRRLYGKIDDLMSLYRDIDPEHGLPPLHGWAIGPDFARYLYQDVMEKKYSRVLECGSGSTTVILAYAMKALGAGHLISLEHDPEYAAATRQMLAVRGLTAWAEVVDAPWWMSSSRGRTGAGTTRRGSLRERSICFWWTDRPDPPARSPGIPRCPSCRTGSRRMRRSSSTTPTDQTRRRPESAGWRSSTAGIRRPSTMRAALSSCVAPHHDRPPDRAPPLRKQRILNGR